MACRLLAKAIYREKDSNGGSAGLPGATVSITTTSMVADLLAVYRRSEAFLGIA